MLKSVSACRRNGAYDCLLQRVTAVILLFYSLYLLGFFIFSGEINYYVWLDFFSRILTKALTMLALTCVLIHGWTGLWQVLTDYVRPPVLRAACQLVIISVLLVYFFSGLFILWRV